MSTISTHVLDTSLGNPAEGIRVTLHRDTSLIGTSVTDSDGRVRGFLAGESSLAAGDYHLTFSVAEYFSMTKRKSFYNEIVIQLSIAEPDEHYHVPLLVEPVRLLHLPRELTARHAPDGIADIVRDEQRALLSIATPTGRPCSPSARTNPPSTSIGSAAGFLHEGNEDHLVAA